MEVLCTTCQQSFTSRNKLFAHIRSEHNERINNGKILPVINTAAFENSTILTAYEDNNVRVIIKPQGLPVMGARKERTLYNVDDLFILNAEKYKKAVPCHRLDKLTGGLVICSKNYETELHVKKSFNYKLVKKRYRAIVVGKINTDTSVYGQININILNKVSETVYEVISHTKCCIHQYITTVDLYPISGRFHQLRRHMQAIGHPILGDLEYYYGKDWPNPNIPMCLWSLEIDFPNPTSSHLYENFVTSIKRKKCDDIVEDVGNEVGDEVVDDMTRTDSCQDTDIISEGFESTLVNIPRERSYIAGTVVPNYLSFNEFNEKIENEWKRRLEGYSDIINVRIDEPLIYEEIRSKYQANSE